MARKHDDKDEARERGQADPDATAAEPVDGGDGAGLENFDRKTIHPTERDNADEPTTSANALPGVSDSGSTVPGAPSVRRAEGEPVVASGNEVGEPQPGERIGAETRGDRVEFTDFEGADDDVEVIDPATLDADDPYEILARFTQWVVENGVHQTGPFIVARADEALAKSQAAIDQMESTE
jgi:hypothetical protein